MKKMFMVMATVAATGFVAANVNASVLNAYLTATPVNTPNNGVYNVDVYASVSGTLGTGGDGGLAGMQFAVDNASTENASVSTYTSPPPLAGHPKYTWGASIDAVNFGRVAPSASTTPPGGADAASFYASPGQYGSTTLGTAGPVLVMSYTFTLAKPSVAAPLNLSIIGPTSFDYNSTGTNYLDNVTTINATGVTLPAVPEPASLSLLAIGAVGLISRRRRHA